MKILAAGVLRNQQQVLFKFDSRLSHSHNQLSDTVA